MPPVFPGKLHLILAERPVRLRKSNVAAHRAWRAFARGGVSLEEIPGDHLTFFRNPNLPLLARKLQNVLDAPEPTARLERNPVSRDL